VRILRRGVRSAVAQLMPSFGVRAALATGAVLACCAAALAETPHPQPTAPQRIDVTKLQPRALAPPRVLHVEMTVEVNKLGQVTRVRTIKPSHDQAFDAHTYGNALQAFIRTPDGHVVVGTYRLTYDYDPKSLRVRRDVFLIRSGGVNPNAQGAALQMMDIARRHAEREAAAQRAAVPLPSIGVRRMPDLPQVMKTATPSPHH